MAKSICNLDKSVLIKIVLLISIIFLIAYILNYASSNKLMEALTTQCGCRGPNFNTADSGCGSVGAPCCREPNKADPQPLCKDGPCGCYEGYVQVNEGGCSSIGGAPCCRHPNGHVWKPFCNKSPVPKPTPTSIPSSETLESCKQKCIEHQADDCKGIVYDALDKKCWFKNFFAGEGEAKANRQAFILNPGCSKPNVPVPPKKPDCCKGWQQTLNCSGSGPPDTRSTFLLSSTHGSHGCKVNVPSGASGYCTCRDGKKLLFDCGHSGFTCEEKCANNCGPPPVKPIHVLPPPKTKVECKKKPLPQPPKT